MPVNTSDVYDLLDGGSANDFGLVAQTFPLYACGATGTILTTGGSVFGSAIFIREKVTVSTLVANVTAAGATLTANNCWGLLFNSAGTLLGQSADQSTAWATAGASSMALTASATGLLTLPAGMYWGAVVATGTTLPTFSRTGLVGSSIATTSALYNLGAGAAQSRTGVLATGITTTPAAITPASITQATGIPYWFGLN